jgi:hypothetical protein
MIEKFDPKKEEPTTMTVPLCINEYVMFSIFLSFEYIPSFFDRELNVLHIKSVA